MLWWRQVPVEAWAARNGERAKKSEVMLMQREFVQIQLGPNRKDAGPTRARGQTRPPATLEIQWPVGEAGWQEQRDGSTEHGSDGWGIETTLEKLSKRCRHEFSNVKIGVGCLPSPSPVTSQHIREFCRPGTSWYLGTYPETRAIADSSPWCHSSRASKNVDMNSTILPSRLLSSPPPAH